MKGKYIREYKVLKNRLIASHQIFANITFEQYDDYHEAITALVVWWKAEDMCPEDVTMEEYLRLSEEMQKTLLSCLKLPDKYKCHPLTQNIKEI